MSWFQNDDLFSAYNNSWISNNLKIRIILLELCSNLAINYAEIEILKRFCFKIMNNATDFNYLALFLTSH